METTTSAAGGGKSWYGEPSPARRGVKVGTRVHTGHARNARPAVAERLAPNARVVNASTTRLAPRWWARRAAYGRIWPIRYTPRPATQPTIRPTNLSPPDAASGATEGKSSLAHWSTGWWALVYNVQATCGHIRPDVPTIVGPGVWCRRLPQRCLHWDTQYWAGNVYTPRGIQPIWHTPPPSPSCIWPYQTFTPPRRGPL